MAAVSNRLDSSYYSGATGELVQDHMRQDRQLGLKRPSATGYCTRMFTEPNCGVKLHCRFSRSHWPPASRWPVSSRELSGVRMDFRRAKLVRATVKLIA